MVEFTISTEKVAQNLLTPVSVKLKVVNISKQIIEVYKNPSDTKYIENGIETDKYGRYPDEDEIAYIKLKPLDFFETEIDPKYFIRFYNTFKDRKRIENIFFSIHAKFIIKSVESADRVYVKSKNELIFEIDYTKTEKLLTPQKEWFWYIKYNNDIVSVSNSSSTFGGKLTKKLSINKTNFNVLGNGYIIDDKKVFRNGDLQRLSAKGFKIFNELFAGNPEKILTSYGDAKIKDPISFKSFSANGNDASYKKGYGIDKLYLYFFDEGSGTTHATICRACKSPSTFKELFSKDSGCGYQDDAYYVYGACERTVYINGISIAMADAKTWQYLASYSKDKKNVFYHTYKVREADVDSFEVIKDPETGKYDEFYERHTYTTLEESRWAKDKNHYYNCGKKTTKEAYELIIKPEKH